MLGLYRRIAWNLLVSLTTASDNIHRYSDLFITISPNPLCSFKITMIIHTYINTLFHKKYFGSGNQKD